MYIRVGYEISYECPQPTPMMLTLNLHYTRASDIIVPDHIVTQPTVPISNVFGPNLLKSFNAWTDEVGAPACQPPVLC